MSRAEWLKRLHEMQAELDEHNWEMLCETGPDYLRGMVFNHGCPVAAQVWIIDDEQEGNERRWSEFEEKCKRLLPWWEVE